MKTTMAMGMPCRILRARGDKVQFEAEDVSGSFTGCENAEEQVSGGVGLRPFRLRRCSRRKSASFELILLRSNVMRNHGIRTAAIVVRASIGLLGACSFLFAHVMGYFGLRPARIVVAILVIGRCRLGSRRKRGETDSDGCNEQSMADHEYSPALNFLVGCG